MLSNLMLHLVSGDRAAFDRASQYVNARIYKNKKDRAGGLVSLLDLYSGNHHKAAFVGCDFIGVAAHFYDWDYAQLSPQQSEDLVTRLIDAARCTELENKTARAVLPTARAL